jgi:hypothetical protein
MWSPGAVGVEERPNPAVKQFYPNQAKSLESVEAKTPTV